MHLVFTSALHEKRNIHLISQTVFGTVAGGYVKLKDMTDYELAVLGRETYDKRQWSAEDVRRLRGCWDEYQRRGEDTIILFHPAYSVVLTFHEIDRGTITEDDVRSLERAGAGIAVDYREVMRRLLGVVICPARPSASLRVVDP